MLLHNYNYNVIELMEESSTRIHHWCKKRNFCSETWAKSDLKYPFLDGKLPTTFCTLDWTTWRKFKVNFFKLKWINPQRRRARRKEFWHTSVVECQFGNLYLNEFSKEFCVGKKLFEWMFRVISPKQQAPTKQLSISMIITSM